MNSNKNVWFIIRDRSVKYFFRAHFQSLFSRSSSKKSRVSMKSQSLEIWIFVVAQCAFWGVDRRQKDYGPKVLVKIPGLYEVSTLRNLNFCYCTVCFLGGSQRWNTLVILVILVVVIVLIVLLHLVVLLLLLIIIMRPMPLTSLMSSQKNQVSI